MYHPRPGEKGKGPLFWPNHLFSEAASAIFYMGIIVFLAGFFPKGLEAPANPFLTPEHIKPEWYFLSLYQVLKIMPKEFMGIADFNKPATLFFSGIVVALLLAVPWLDRTHKYAQHPKARPIMTALFSLGLIAFVVLTYLGGQ